MELKGILIAALVFAAGVWTPRSSASEQERMLQCEECSTQQDMLSFAMAQVAAPGRGQFTGHIFSLKHRLIQKVLVAYNVPNPGQRASQLLQNNPAVEDGFAAMLNAYQIDSRTFIAQQTYRGRIDDLPTKGHDPVRISADGSHSSADLPPFSGPLAT